MLGMVTKVNSQYFKKSDGYGEHVKIGHWHYYECMDQIDVLK